MKPNSPSLSFQHVSQELRLFCGEESLAALARELRRNGCNRAVVVCGRSVGASHAMTLLRDAIGSTLAGECNTVQPNSPVCAVTEAARVLRELDADAVVAVGGGSAAVTARAASILLAEKLSVTDLCTRRLANGQFESPRLGAPKLPQFVVPTTPSTAFVKAGSGVLDAETGHRLALFDPKTRARAIFLHPAFLRSAPSELILSASLNTLSTAVEALESPQCDPVSEAMLTHALRLTARSLTVGACDDVAAREHLAIAAVLCGRGTDQSGGGLASVLAHAIGHLCHASNGYVNGIVLPHTMRFNAPVTQSCSLRITESLRRTPSAGAPASDGAGSAVEALESLLLQLPVPRRLRDIGIAVGELDDVANAAMSDWFISRNPRPVSSSAEVREILAAAW